MSILNQNTSIGHSRSLSTCPYYRVGAGGLNYTSTSPDNYDNGQRLHSPIGELSDGGGGNFLTAYYQKNHLQPKLKFNVNSYLILV